MIKKNQGKKQQLGFLFAIKGTAAVIVVCVSGIWIMEIHLIGQILELNAPIAVRT